MKRTIARDCVVLGLLLFGVTGKAQQGPEAGDRAATMLELLRQQPAQMDRATWLVQRREAARELGRLRERRAVPLLLDIVRRERLDVVLEIAITALGEIGDPSAAPALRTLLGDPMLDKYVKGAAENALDKLTRTGSKTPSLAPPEKEPQPVETPTLRAPPAAEDRTVRQPRPPRPDREEHRRRTPSRAPRTPSLSGDDFGRLPPLKKRPFSPRIIALQDRLQIAAGALDVSWDSGAGQTSAGLLLASIYTLQVERRRIGYSIQGELEFDFHLQQPAKGDSTWALQNSLQINPEVRYYPLKGKLSPVFAQLTAGAGYHLTAVSHPLYLDHRLAVAGNLSVGGGAGYGRIKDKASRLRLERVQALLLEAGVIEEPLSRAVARKLMLAWYQLRNHLGVHAHLGHTWRILRKHELLKTQPGPGLIYKLVKVLEDPQLDHRPEGTLIRLGYGYARSMIMDAVDTNLGFIYATARYNRQFSAVQAFESSLRFFYQMLGTPDYYGVSGAAAYRHYFYSARQDPLGSLAISLSGGVSSLPGAAFSGGAIGYRWTVGGAYCRHFNRGSMVSIKVSAGMENAAAVVLATVEARYGLISGSFTAR